MTQHLPLTKEHMNVTEPKFDEREIELLRACLNSHWVTQGPFAKKFEQAFAQKHQVSFALTTTSCTAALHLAVLALGLGPEDEVIVPAFTWVTSANCVEYVGARVVFVDVEPNSFNLGSTLLEKAITPNTKAIVVVHLFGLAAKMDEIMTVARKHHLYVIEDAACAVGTTYRDKPVGGFGDVGCFSFHPRKIITTGEGGMVTTNFEKIALKIQSLRNHGATGVPPAYKENPKPYAMSTFDVLGYNLRMSDIQAAVGVAQMEKLDALLSERKQMAKNYDELLCNVNRIAPPIVPQGCGHTYQSYVIRVLQGGRQKRNEIMDYLASLNIQTRPGTHAVHRLGYYQSKYHLSPSDFPVASLCEDMTITLPLFPGMTLEDQQVVISNLKKAL